MSRLLLHNCRILQVGKTETEILEKQDILITEQYIEAIEPVGVINPEQSHEIIDAAGMVALPGLINTHAHVPMVLFRGLAEDVDLETWFNDYMWPLERNLEAEDVYWGMLLGLAEMIEAGVTTVADHYFYMDLAARAVTEAGTRAALGWAVFGSQGTDGLDLTARFAEQFQNAADGRITTWLAPHAPYTCDDQFLRGIARRAEKLNAGIHIHVSETQEQTEQSIANKGLTPIEVLEQTGILDHRTILAHCCGITDSDIKLLSPYPCGIAHAPKTYMKLAMGTPPIAALLKENIAVGLASDGAVSNNTLDIWESMRLMALLQKFHTGKAENITIHETLTTATRGSAAVLNLSDKIGVLAPGFLADIILVDMSGPHHQPLHNIPANLVYATRSSDVQTVIVNGQVLMKNRELLTLNKKDIFDHVNKRMHRLAKRVPNVRIQQYKLHE